MWNSVKSLLGGPRSAREAKGRLHLVLAHDRCGLDGARLHELRQELAQVLARYVDIDPDSVEIQVERVNPHGTELRVSSPLRVRSART
jgi:cell division topological specificity factor